MDKLIIAMMIAILIFLLIKIKWKPQIKYSILVLTGIVFCVAFIAISKYVVEHEMINVNEPIIYTRKSQYLDLYNQNKAYFHDLVETLKQNKVDYEVSLLWYKTRPITVYPKMTNDAYIAYEKLKNKKQATFNNLMKNPEFAKKINYLAEQLKMNYIFFDEPLKDGLYHFTRIDMSVESYRNDMRIIYCEQEPESLLYYEKIDKNWYLYSGIRNESMYDRVYNLIYNHS